MLELWGKEGSDLAGKGPGDTYGAEHLCRLLGIFPGYPLLQGFIANKFY
jgi:hypothetical protein